MTETEHLLNIVDELRQDLNNLIKREGSNLHDPEVVAVSQMLDAVITKYYEVCCKHLVIR